MTGSVHLKILKLVEIPYYLQMGANNNNNKAARASVYTKGGILNGDGEESPRRSFHTSGGVDALDVVGPPASGTEGRKDQEI